MKVPTKLCPLQADDKERGSLAGQEMLDKSHSPVVRHHRRHRGPNPTHAARANGGQDVLETNPEMTLLVWASSVPLTAAQSDPGP